MEFLKGTFLEGGVIITSKGTMITKSAEVHVSLEKLQSCRKWIEFIEQFEDPSCPIFLKSFHIHVIYMFGDNIGFIVGEGEAYYGETKIRIPAFIFIRGDSASVFVLVTSKEKRYLLLIKQLRFSVANWFYETIAGCMDENGDFFGVAIKEAKEEAGIEIPSSHLLVDLGLTVPSVGGTKETVHLFLYVHELEDEQMATMATKVFGNKDEGEATQVVFVPLNVYMEKPEMFDMDAKIECSFNRARRLGFI
jgi:ADP-sugar diphosphatase